MTIVLHAITERAPEELPLDDLRTHDDGSLVVVYEERDQPVWSSSELVTFARVLRHLWEHTSSLLPMRFGTTVDTREDLVRTVAEHRREWSQRLEALRDRSELIVHLRVDPEPAAAAVGGRGYLERLAARHHVRGDRVASLREAMAAYADEERALPDAEGWRWSFLVRDAEVVAAGDAVRAWATAHGVEAEVTGPWPPFSFCREESA